MGWEKFKHELVKLKLTLVFSTMVFIRLPVIVKAVIVLIITIGLRILQCFFFIDWPVTIFKNVVLTLYKTRFSPWM